MATALKASGEAQLQPLAEPRDTYKVAYVIHFLLGAGNLLPWNAFITAVDYFEHLYPDKHVTRVFSVVYMTSSLAVLAAVVGLGGWSRKLSFRTRMNLGYAMFIVSLMAAPIMDWTWRGTESKTGTNDGEYVVTVLSVVLCGLADGLIAGSLIGSVGRLPKQYMQAVFAGNASAGVLVSILRIITKASLPQSPRGLRTGAHFYFIVGAFILLVCTTCSNLLYYLPIMQQRYMCRSDDVSSSSNAKFYIVTKKIQSPCLGIVAIYIVTLSIFPGFISEDISSRFLKDWFPVLLITVYNVGDLTGKSIPAIYVMKSVKRATWACVGRVVFYPLFMACLHGPNWLKSEVPVAVLTFLLGLTNGYLTSVLMILTPKSVPASEAEISAIIMIVSLGVGLVIGSFIGWFWII